MNTDQLKNKLHQYIDKASEEELEDLLSFVEEEQGEYTMEKKYDHWEDEEFVKEMDRRVEDFESGKNKGVPWEEVHREVREMLDNMKKN